MLADFVKGTLAVVILSCAMPVIAASPSSEELVKICEQALLNGYRGRQAQMCTWYVIPCDCDAPNEDTPRVCIPDNVPSRKIAEQAMQLLKALPEYKNADGRVAASQVLSVVYPCAEL